MAGCGVKEGDKNSFSITVPEKVGPKKSDYDNKTQIRCPQNLYPALLQIGHFFS